MLFHKRHRWYACSLLFFLLFIGVSDNLWAHKVNIFAYVEGQRVYTESYFPDGSAVKGGEIAVLDSEGNVLLSGVTDDEGMYQFEIPKIDDLTIVLDASMGHRATYEIGAEELGETSIDIHREDQNAAEVETANENDDALSEGIDFSGAERSAFVNIDDLREVVKEEVAAQIQPLSRNIAKLQKQERVSTREIFAGIGYIVGLMGLFMYFQSKRGKG